VLLINKVQEGRLMSMENVPQDGELTLFLDYSVQQLLENRNVPIEMWNVNKHRYRTNSAFGGWDSKLNSITGKQQPIVFLQVQQLKASGRTMALGLTQPLTEMSTRNVPGGKGGR
jgi:hypothetical protein